VETAPVLESILRNLSSGQGAPGVAIEEVARHAAQDLGFERAAILVPDGDGSVHGVSSYGMPSSMIRVVAEPRSNMALLDKAIRDGSVATSEYVLEDNSIPEHLVEHFGLSSLAAAPLVSGGSVLGVLCVDQWGHRFSLTRDQRAHVDAFTREAAIGLRLAQLVSDGSSAAVHAERLRVARRLHDTTAQLLYTIGNECARARTEASTADAAITRIEQLAAIGSEEIRHVIDTARATEGADPSPNRMGGVLARLRELYGCEIGATGDWPRISISSPVGDLLLAVVREGIANAVKHGAARNVVLWLQHSEALIRLEVRDDGSTDNRRPAHGGSRGTRFGLADLGRRLAQWGGWLTLCQNDDGGHTLRVSLPGPLP
jgi:signal transduction histidine kinase